jgi:hypothetical protein
VHSIAVDKPEQKREFGRNGLAMEIKLRVLLWKYV